MLLLNLACDAPSSSCSLFSFYCLQRIYHRNLSFHSFNMPFPFFCFYYISKTRIWRYMCSLKNSIFRPCIDQRIQHFTYAVVPTVFLAFDICIAICISSFIFCNDKFAVIVIIFYMSKFVIEHPTTG